jgi:hypothetical protein
MILAHRATTETVDIVSSLLSVTEWRKSACRNLTIKGWTTRDLAHAIGDAHLAGRDRHRHALADQLPRHRVAVGVDLDGAIATKRAPC